MGRMGPLILLLAAPLCSAQSPEAPRAVAKVLMAKDLADFAGREGTLTALEYPPGASRPFAENHNRDLLPCEFIGPLVQSLSPWCWLPARHMGPTMPILLRNLITPSEVLRMSVIKWPLSNLETRARHSITISEKQLSK